MGNAELWWGLNNPARFLEDTKEKLRKGKSLILRFDSSVPWQDKMIKSIKNCNIEFAEHNVFDVLDVGSVKEPGKYLEEKYPANEKYWPDPQMSREKFLAKADTALNKRCVILTGIKKMELANSWTNSISEYLTNANPEKHGVFVLIVENVSPFERIGLETVNYSDYVSDYDCMVLCMMLVSGLKKSEKLSKTEKMYLCELASNIAGNNVEIAALLASEGFSLILEPLETVKNVFDRNNIRFTELRKHVNASVWEAQNNLFFPKLESFRSRFINGHYSELESVILGVKSYESVESPSDLEIGQLYFICKNIMKDLASKQEYNTLEKMRGARNRLAHLQTLSYNELKELL